MIIYRIYQGSSLPEADSDSSQTRTARRFPFLRVPDRKLHRTVRVIMESGILTTTFTFLTALLLLIDWEYINFISTAVNITTNCLGKANEIFSDHPSDWDFV